MKTHNKWFVAALIAFFNAELGFLVFHDSIYSLLWAFFLMYCSGQYHGRVNWLGKRIVDNEKR